MRGNQSGSTIVVVVSVIATLAVFIGGALDYTFTVARNVERSNKMAQATAIANGTLQYEFMYWREYCRANSATQGPPTSTFSSMPLPTSTQFPNVSNFTATTGTSSSYTVSNFGVTALTPQLQAISGTTSPVPGIAESGTNKTFFYRGSATVTLPDRGLPVKVNTYQVFEQQYQNPWEWALFFVDPLEIEPGVSMTVTGWVQTNSSLYTPLNLLTFASKVTYGTNWYISAMPGDNHLIADGDTYADPNWPANEPPVQGTPTEPFGLTPSDIFNSSSPNADGYHELIEVPDPSYPDPLLGQRYFDVAGVKVILSSNSSSITATVYDSTTLASVSHGTTILGTTIGTISYSGVSKRTTTTTTSGDSTYQKTLFSTISSALTLNQSIQDNREGMTVAITELNVGTITTAINNGTLSGFNQIIYIDDSSSTQTAERGVELTNGSSLPTNGLTVASANPVYVVGDYNTGTNPPSDSGNVTSPTNSSYTRQPSSIIADAVDILSNNWSNSNSTSSLSSRAATNTTVNAAIMSGNVPTSGGNYSGGAENFPRFLEDWSSATLTYYGSMVELYASQQANGIWGQDNVYNPPTRAWYYDTNYQIKSPPGTIMVVSYLQGQWYQQ